MSSSLAMHSFAVVRGCGRGYFTGAEPMPLQIRREPAPCVRYRYPCARREIGELILADFSNREITRVGVGEIKTRHRCRRKHRKIFGDRHADFYGLQQI